MNKPPEGLVPLNSLPRDTWLGRFIYHPMQQDGGGPYWKPLNAPAVFQDPDVDPHVYNYDVGVVTKFMLSSVFYGDNVNDPDHYQVWFKDPTDTSEWEGLHYGADNCWTADPSSDSE